MLVTPPSSSRSFPILDRPSSAGSARLQVPGNINVRGSNSKQSKSRSRSYSPFGNNRREKLPCGSPTFERVLCDMLSDQNLDGNKSDNEVTLEAKPVKTRRDSTCKSKNKGERRLSISPRATARK